MKRFAVMITLMIGIVLMCSAPSAHAIMGLGKCVKACDGDKECIKECRDMHLSEEDSKELYKQEFRDCFDTCYELRGKEKQDCLDSCRDDYKLGRDLPRD